MPRFDVNLSILFTELPLDRRPAAAREAGFDAVEFWWPWPTAAPADRDVEAFVRSINDAGVRLVGLNFFAGDMPAGERGLVSWPGRETEFRDGVDIAVDVARRLGCRAFNALYGNRLVGVDAKAQDEVAVRNLAMAAAAVGHLGGVVLVEPVSGVPAYPLRTAAHALAVVDRIAREIGASNLSLLCDVYHLATNGDDPHAAITGYAGRIGHVQIADAPGRHQPGTGRLDIPAMLRSLDETGYRGWVGLEYQPDGPSADSFGWLPPERRWAATTVEEPA